MQNNNPLPGQQNNLVQEIGLITLSVTIVVGAVVLLILGKIDPAQLIASISVAGALWGFNGALKAPSPAQAQTVQQIASQAMAVLPLFANLLHSHASAPVPLPQQQVQGQPTAPNAVVSRPVASPQGQQTAAPFQPTLTSMVPPTPQGASPGVSTTTLQPQAQRFKPPVFTPLPEISVPMAAMPPTQPPTQQS